ncbi:putative peptidase S8 [Halomicronema hongdechloris C2206]|uniref:Peptidase S8 n=1 Tax=Halomicronema hongdechloris C2206 TaxID=1641165 RepID=A0A1Z3HVB8_9CYAN|nr:S8 family peptidase [Halomicronema hongdechloris]ASC74260.1 putative peptidase S8 [Halomicronema hongdechloris C2206]
MKWLLWTALFLVGVLGAIATFTGPPGDYDSLILDVDDGVPNAEIEQVLAAIATDYPISFHLNSEFSDPDNLYVLTGAAIRDRTFRQALRRSRLGNWLEVSEPNYQYHTHFVPNDPDYNKQWNLRNIGIEAAWGDSRGQGVTVAVIDTGISPVPDLAQTEFVAGYDFINDHTEAIDDNGHGTHVAGTIAQSTNNGYGVAGIAYEARLMPLKVLSAAGGGTVADIAEAIQFATDHQADVINLSLGGFGDSQVLREATEYAHDHGVMLVAAAGNAGQNAANYPARYPHVMAVAALDATGQKTPYSNFGAGVDLTAPGGLMQPDNQRGGILQNTLDPETGNPIFKAFQGTSMAAPHVAGVAALVKAVGIDDPDDIVAILQQSAQAVPDDPLNHYGAGQLNAAAAVKLAGQGQLSPRHFIRWLRDNGYLNLKFWFDGGAVALLPKLAMVLGSYLLAWLLQKYVPFAWTGSLSAGLVMGSTGLFFLRGLYVFDLPQWPLRVAASSIPELGNVITGSSALNPLFASLLIPVILMALLLSHGPGQGFALGVSLGMAVFLGTSALFDPQLLWLGPGTLARLFLAVNAVGCLGVAHLIAKTAGRPVAA